MSHSPSPAEEPQDPQAAARKARARTVIFSILGLAAVAGVGAAVRNQVYGQYMQTTNNAFVQADTVTVSPKVSGYVEAVLVQQNQVVKAGQPLVRIDPRAYRAQSDQFQASIAIAQASAQAVEAQIAEQRASIERAQSELATAQSDAAFARREAARYAPLAASGAETAERAAQLEQQARQAANKVIVARAAVESAHRRVETLEAQVRQAKAQGQAARAQLRSAELDIGSTVLVASVDGRVGDRSVRVGQYVQASTRLMSIVPSRGLYVEANFKETQVGRMRVGQPVKIEIDALPGVEIEGRVASIAPATGAQFSVLPPQNATGNFTKIVQRVPVVLEAKLTPEVRAVLTPGMSAEVTVDTRSARTATSDLKKAQERHNQQDAR